MKKECGGLGVKDLRKFSLVLLGKWWGRLAKSEEGLWRKVIIGKYGESRGHWFDWVRDSRGGGSIWWRDIQNLNVGDRGNAGWLMEGFRIKLGEGEGVSFWWNEWCGENCLANKFPRLYVLSTNEAAKELQKTIEKVKISPGCADRWEWVHITDGKYSTAIAYAILAKQRRGAEEAKMYKRVWNPSLPTKVATFNWKTASISKAAGILSIWMIPQLFAYAMNYPMAKFLQAQSKMMAMAVIAAAALVLHTLFSWLLMLKLEWGLVGAAVVLNASWWFIIVAQFLYIISGTCGPAWTGFSWKAFQNLWSFARLSLASAVMLCLEVWYFMALILFAGYLKNAEVSVDALSICMNILGWTIMVALGMNAAISVRVSNELGAGHPRAAKLSLAVAVISSFMIGLAISIVFLIFQKEYPYLFSNHTDVQELVRELTPLLVLCIVINFVQPVLSGVAVGAGWQAVVAYVNIGCYYIFGVPLGLILGYKLDFGVKGIWCGMLSGTTLQTIVLFVMIYKTNWNSEASIAEDRIKKWGGEEGSKENNVGKNVEEKET
ncbi:hypothetical protein SLEP1_g25427 [Rubroshorea leprosula]|uniref:Protein DETOXIFICATION n=1 Tax=Rubroshorea leprosula TaxID=152421 RepID=A0AAV5JIZ5_9ROSI|nr:hypothetical protein SLEP1_g25427 [Rubroshorea leprosula]